MLGAVKHGCIATVDLPCSGVFAHTEVQVAVIKQCLTNERYSTGAKLSACTISALMVFRILQKDLKTHKWMTYIRWTAKLDLIPDTPYQSGVLPTWRKWGFEPNYCHWWNLGISIGTRSKEAIKWMASLWFTTKAQVLRESITHEGSDHFGI